jgi:Ni/Co efflux regulator RcnB
MKKLIVPAAAIFALSLGVSVVSAQPYQSQSTTVRTSPDTGTQTTTTTSESKDAYGTYRKTVTSTKRYDAGAFAAPRGYTYSRFAVGDHVPSVLLNSNLTLADYGSYQLDAPPPGLVWIRDGQDALLVDQSNGEVVQADYDLFN